MTKKIMTIEDAGFMSGIMKEIFTGAGYDVVAQAANGMDGLDKFKDCRPEIVVLDIAMPVMDGLDVLKELMKIDPCTRVVMCTALSQPDKVLLSLLNGASGYVVKPFQAETLLAAVESIYVEKPVFYARTIESYMQNHEKIKSFARNEGMLAQDEVEKVLQLCKNSLTIPLYSADKIPKFVYLLDKISTIKSVCMISSIMLIYCINYNDALITMTH